MEIEAASIRYPYLADFTSPKWGSHRSSAMTGAASPTSIAQGFSWLSYPDAASLIAALLRAQWQGHRTYFPAAPGPRSRPNVSQLLEKYYRNTPRKAGFEKDVTALVDISAITRDTGWSPKDLNF